MDMWIRYESYHKICQTIFQGDFYKKGDGSLFAVGILKYVLSRLDKLEGFEGSGELRVICSSDHGSWIEEFSSRLS